VCEILRLRISDFAAGNAIRVKRNVCVLTVESSRRGCLEDDPYEISIDYPTALPRIHDAHGFYPGHPRPGDHFDPRIRADRLSD
jgi:hypothetical protein